MSTESKYNHHTPRDPNRRQAIRDEIIGAIHENPKQDPCFTLDGGVVQEGKTHMNRAIILTEMVADGKIQRTAEGIWQTIPLAPGIESDFITQNGTAPEITSPEV